MICLSFPKVSQDGQTFITPIQSDTEYRSSLVWLWAGQPYQQVGCRSFLEGGSGKGPGQHITSKVFTALTPGMTRLLY